MSLVARAQNIIMKPKEEWLVVAQETPDTGKIMTGYVIPLAILPAVGSLLGYGLMGLGFKWGIAWAITAAVGAIVGTLVTAFVVDALAPSFGSEKDMGRSMQLVAYANTPAWVAGILNIIPFLGLVTWIASLYGIYLLYLGLSPVKKTPEDKRVIYTIVALVITFAVNALFAMVIGGILVTLFVGAAATGAAVGGF